MPASDWYDLAPHTVVHKAYAGLDDYGSPYYNSSGTSYRARITYKPTRVKLADGSEVISKAVVWLLGTPTIDAKDRLELSDGSVPAILLAEKVSDGEGYHHVKVFLG